MEFEEVENIGQRIKEIRKSKSITIQKLSQFTDLSVGYLSNLERNQASPTLNNLQRICVALGISIRDLLSPSGEERTLIRQEEQQLYEYDEYKLQIRRLDFGKKRGLSGAFYQHLRKIRAGGVSSVDHWENNGLSRTFGCRKIVDHELYPAGGTDGNGRYQ